MPETPENTEITEFTPPFDAEGGLVLATQLPGGRKDLHTNRRSWDRLDDGDERRPLWVHLDRTKDRAKKWIREEAGLDPLVADALLADGTRPRFQAVGDGLLVILRGVNMNPGAEPDDMIAIRLWLDPTRVITLRGHRFQTIVEIRNRAEEGRAPASVGGFLVAVAAGLAARMAPSVDNLEEMLDGVEAEMIETDNDNPEHRRILATIRRQAISYRRHLVPQRDAIVGIALEASDLITPRERAELRGVGEQVARIAEDLEELRDRAAVTQEEMRARREARINRTLYLLTIVATVALPLGLLTGLLGINVGGLPLANSPWGFTIVTFGLIAIAAGEVAVFKWLRLM